MCEPARHLGYLLRCVENGQLSPGSSTRVISVRVAPKLPVSVPVTDGRTTAERKGSAGTSWRENTCYIASFFLHLCICSDWTSWRNRNRGEREKHREMKRERKLEVERSKSECESEWEQKRTSESETEIQADQTSIIIKLTACLSLLDDMFEDSQVFLIIFSWATATGRGFRAGSAWKQGNPMIYSSHFRYCVRL